MELQQQFKMQNTIFDLPHNWFYSFFFMGGGECHVPGEPCKKAVLMLLFPREIQGMKWENDNFLNCSQIIVLNLVCSMFLVNEGTLS